jgi:hypothetical protein
MLRSEAPAAASRAQGSTGIIMLVGLGLVLANLLLSLYSVPAFTLPARLKGPELPERGGKGGRGGAGTPEGGAASCAGSAPASAPKAAPAGGRRRAAADDYLTHERCYAQPDEAETCFYTGPLCYDGERAVVGTRTPRGNDARTSMCYDFRHFVPSQSCGYNGPHRRDDLPPGSPVPFLQDDVPRVVSVPGKHKWGPMGREVAFREVGDDVLRDPSPHNMSIVWLDGPLYIAGVHHSWLDHTWHFAAAAMGLFDVKRHNNTFDIPDNGLVTAGSWDAPPMSYLVLAGQYRPVADMKDLRPWIRNLLTMLIQSDTEMLWNTKLDALGVKPDNGKWVCAREGAILGLKPRMFNSELEEGLGVGGGEREHRHAHSTFSHAPTTLTPAPLLPSRRCRRRPRLPPARLQLRRRQDGQGQGRVAAAPNHAHHPHRECTLTLGFRSSAARSSHHGDGGAGESPERAS